MPAFVDPDILKSWLHDGREIALFDVREHGQYGQAHPFYAVPLPYSQLEAEVGRLAPRRSVRVVLVDDDERVASRAAARLAALGYTDVHVLRGGVPAWRQAGYQVFAGVHLPSKTFGELVEHAFGTPHVTAQELAAMQARGDKLVVLDGRPKSEFRKMNIPGAICCPNGELGLRARTLAGDADTTIVINCAGRTRSIIGAQTLINLGVANPVFALENGTQGWYLNDLQLEHGGTRAYDGRIDERELPEAQRAAQALASRTGVSEVEAAEVAAWFADPARTTYLCDVRTPEEFRAGSLAGAQHAPGGQLLQGTDLYVGVRGARIVVFDDEQVRAPIIASWLRMMGHDAFVLRGGLASGLAAPVVAPPAAPVLPRIDARALEAALAAGRAVAVDLRGSMAFRQASIPGSQWSIRPLLADDLAAGTRDIVLVADDEATAAWAAQELPDAQRARVSVLAGGLPAWRDAGLPVVSTPDVPPDARCIDYLFFVHDRHDGNKEAARQYLAWELGLVAQLDERELAGYRLTTP